MVFLVVVFKFFVFVSKVVSIFSKILTRIFLGGKRIPLPHQLNYWGVARPGCPPKSAPMFGVETGREVGGRGLIRIGFVEEQCFKFGVKEL